MIKTWSLAPKDSQCNREGYYMLGVQSRLRCRNSANEKLLCMRQMLYNTNNKRNSWRHGEGTNKFYLDKS